MMNGNAAQLTRRRYLYDISGLGQGTDERRLLHQKFTLRPNWMTRGAPAPMIEPKPAAPNTAWGAFKGAEGAECAGRTIDGKEKQKTSRGNFILRNISRDKIEVYIRFNAIFCPCKLVEQPIGGAATDEQIQRLWFNTEDGWARQSA
jgi:hypothetical protein